MNKKVRRVFIKLFCVLALFIILSGNMRFVLGTDNFDTEGFEGKSNTDMSSGITKGFGAALSVIRIVGTGIAVIALLVIAIRYMVSSPGQRADYKKNLLGFAIGALILIAASQILGAISDVSGQIMN